ncbi:MAG TPA: MAPEG family protein [Labilithrix sp.]|jgi:hypothetical protein
MDTALETQQSKVKMGIVVGVLAWTEILATSWFLTGARVTDLPLADRLGLAARCAVFPALTLMAGVLAVANGRYRSAAIDPLTCEATPAMRVDQRYLQNTLEQLVLHVVALFAVAADGSPLGMRLLPGLAACFVVGRAAFWLLYRRDPMKRGPGFSMTMQPTAVALVFVAVRTLLVRA